jgi:glycosyltransferase involved in cell wall biosynthesis
MKLSIIMMAYNQGKYIDEAISSVLNQVLPESGELLIGDDCSKDNTAEIVEPWLAKYPNNIQYFLRKENIGLHANYIDLMNHARGEYIALLEADDYWLDRFKTQKQIELMDANSDMAWCTTDGYLVSEDGTIIKEVNRDLPVIFNFDYFLTHFFNPLNNATIFRKSSEPSIYPDYFSKVKQWDTVLYYLRSLNGKIGYIPIKGLAWRRHENATSFTSKFSGANRYIDWIVINNGIKPLMKKKIGQTHFNNKAAYERLAALYFKEKNLYLAAKYLVYMLVTAPYQMKYLRDYLWRIRN